MTININNINNLKRKLFVSKCIATSLLITAMISFIMSNKYLDYHYSIKYIRAFSEASMVGALADWFAVVALFKRPMGLPIPHTAILPNNKNKLARQIGNFFSNNFLADNSIPKLFYNMKIVTSFLHWLQTTNNKQTIVSFIHSQLVNNINKIDHKIINKYLINIIQKNISGKQLAEINAILLQLALNNRYEQKILNKFLLKINKEIYSTKSICFIREFIIGYVKNNENKTNSLLQRIANIMPNNLILLNDFIPNKIANIIHNYCEEILANDEHEARLFLNQQLNILIKNLKTSVKLQSSLSNAMLYILKSDNVNAFSVEIYNDILKFINNDYIDNHSIIRNKINSLYEFVLHNLLTTNKTIHELETRLYVLCKTIITTYKNEVSKFIENKINTWDTNQLIEQLELYVGKDLQFIRINGTIVGGIVGVIICLLSNNL